MEERSAVLPWKVERRNGETQDADFRNCLLHGAEVRVVYANGDHYDGVYVDGKKQGVGKFSWRDGGEYVGEWHNDRQHGNGVMSSSCGTYIGEWRNGSPHGQGRWTWPDGCLWHSGQWMKGRPFGLSELQTSTLPKMCLFVDDALTKPSEFN